MSHRNYYVPEANKRRRKRGKKKKNPIMLILCTIIIVLLIFIFVLLFSIIEDNKNQNIPQPTIAPTQYIEPTIAPTSTPEPENRAGVFLNEIKSALEGQLGSNEYYTNIALNGMNVYIGIDISNADTSLLPRKYIAEGTTCSVTDAFLDITEYDDLWDSVTLDFGNSGVVTLYKTDIEVNEYNLRYFNSLKYIDKFK